MQHKNTMDTSKQLEPSEGQQSVLCCNGASIGCPSLHLSFQQVKRNLLNRGMSQEDFDGLMGFLKSIARQFIEEQLRINNKQTPNNGY